MGAAATGIHLCVYVVMSGGTRTQAIIARILIRSRDEVQHGRQRQSGAYLDRVPVGWANLRQYWPEVDTLLSGAVAGRGAFIQPVGLLKALGAVGVGLQRCEALDERLDFGFRACFSQ